MADDYGVHKGSNRDGDDFAFIVREHPELLSPSEFQPARQYGNVLDEMRSPSLEVMDQQAVNDDMVLNIRYDGQRLRGNFADDSSVVEEEEFPEPPNSPLLINEKNNNFLNSPKTIEKLKLQERERKRRFQAMIVEQEAIQSKARDLEQGLDSGLEVKRKWGSSKKIQSLEEEWKKGCNRFALKVILLLSSVLIMCGMITVLVVFLSSKEAVSGVKTDSFIINSSSSAFTVQATLVTLLGLKSSDVRIQTSEEFTGLEVFTSWYASINYTSSERPFDRFKALIIQGDKRIRFSGIVSIAPISEPSQTIDVCPENFKGENCDSCIDGYQYTDGKCVEIGSQPPTTTTIAPTTIEPTTIEPTTTTIAPTTIEPTTIEPTTTIAPTTIEPTTLEPTTIEPTTQEPSTTTVEPTTQEPSTTTVEPTTQEPSTTTTPEVSTLEPTTTTPEPTVTTTPEPTVTSTPEPTVTSTPEPTVTTTPEPTVKTTPEPTVTTTPEPTVTTTYEPTVITTPEPTVTTTTTTPEPTIVSTTSSSSAEP